MTANQPPEPDTVPRPGWWTELPARLWGMLRRIGQSLPATFARLRTGWRQRSPFMRHFLIGLLVGLGIELLLHVMHHQLTALQELEDMAIDGLIKIGWSTGLNRPATPFVLLNIDEPTYRAWGEPFHIPRDHLRKLIDYAVQGGAALVIVDIDLSQRGHDPTADQQLQDYLAHYGTTGKPPLLLARAFRPPLPDQAIRHFTERRSFLEADPGIADSPLIHWGATLFELDQNRVLRRWRLWQVTCDAQGQPTAVPSLQLLAVALLAQPGADPRQVTNDLRQQLQTVLPTACDAPPMVAGHGETITIAGLILSARPEGLAQRILYELTWRLQPGQAYPSLPGPDGSRLPLLSVFSALPMTRSDSKPVAKEAVAGRVVIIGGSFWESRDLQLTPLGLMPGVLVLINAIHSLQQHGEMTPPPLYLKLLITVLLILMISLTFTRLHSFRAMVVASLAIIIGLLPVSYYWFKTGVWLDFVIPLCAVMLHWMAARFEEHRHTPPGGAGH